MDKFKSMGKMSIPKLYLIGAAVAIFVLVVLAGFFFWKYMAVKGTDNSATSEAQETSDRVVSQIGKIYKLPTGEEPTVAQVQDKSKLSKQAFFEAAENGDYILVYKKAKLALLYRESIGKLINVGPVTLDEQQAAGQGAPGTQDRKN